MVRRSSCGPIACWILARTSSLVTWDTWYLAVAPHFRGLHSSLELCCEGPWFTSIQEDGCDKGAHQSYLELREILLSFKTSFNLVNAAVVCAVLESISGLEPSSVITEPRYLKLVTVSSCCPFTLICVDQPDVTPSG